MDKATCFDNQMLDAIPLIGVRRHRLLTDGNGITTLVAFHGCPLNCAYCLNPQCKMENGIVRWITPKSLFNELMCDDIYFRSTGGGVCFGGGEPLLRCDFIKEFKKLCNTKWKIVVETSLNVPKEDIVDIVDIVDEFIVDIKDMSSTVYSKYTGKDNDNVLDNLQCLSDSNKSNKVLIRVPLIPKYNTEQDVEYSIKQLLAAGFMRFDRFVYRTEKIPKVDESECNDKMPVGKAICEVLKKVRLTIAKANDIDYSPAICNHTGNCLGTCPRCEYELKTLSEEIWKRELEGKNINL